MKFAKIENGQIVKVVSRLPENYENTSGFNRLSLDELIARGWLPVVDVQPALGPLEGYGEPVVTIEALQVTRTFPVTAPTVAQARQYMRQQIRDELKAKLYQNLDVDDYVALLVMQVVPANVKTRVEAIKAAYDAAITEVNSAGTVAAVLAVTASWPA